MANLANIVNNVVSDSGVVLSSLQETITLTTTGTSGAATLVGNTLNIPQYQGGVTSFNTRTGAVTLSSSDVTTALGYTPVTNARTITINGTTYDLTANRSWTVSGSMPSGGTAGQILSKIDATDYNTQWIDNYAEQVKHEVKLGATIAKGKAVYVSSADGTNMIVSAASNASEATSSKVLGLLETGGVTNDIVKVVTEGLVAGLDTSTATAGDPVWLGTSGNLIFGLANKPVAPAHLVFIGIVTRVQSNNGEIFVNVQNGFEIEELHNVLFTSKADKDLMYYDNATSLWKNAQLSTILGYTPYSSANPNNYIALTALSSTATGLTYTNTTGVFSLTSGYVIPTTTQQTNWNTAYGWGNHASAGYLTTSSAASTYQPLDADLTAIAGLAGTSGLLKKTAADTWSLDTNTYLTSITSSNVTTALGYTPVTNARTLTINGTTYDLSADRSWTVSAGTTLNGTGFVKASGTTISYDNSTYVPTNGTGATGTWGISISGNAATVSSITANTGLMIDRLTPSGVIDGLTTANFRSTLFGTTTTAAAIATARWNTTPSVLSGLGPYGTMMAWAASDTQGFLAIDYNGANARIGGGNGNSINWTAVVLHSSNFNSYAMAGAGYSANQNLTTGSSPTFFDVYVNSWFRNTGSNGLYNGNHGQHWYSDGQGWFNSAAGGAVGTGGIRFRDNYASTTRGHIYYTNSNEFGLLTAGGNWVIRTDNSANTWLNGAITTGQGNGANAYTPYHASFKPNTNVTFNIGQSTGNRGIAGPFLNATRNGISDTTSVPIFFNCESFNVFLNYDQKMWIEPVYGDMYLRGYIYQGSTNWSDLRMKQNLKQIENPLLKIKGLNGYTFEWKEDTPYRKVPHLVNRINDAGLVAQEVQEVFPDIVELDTKRDQFSLNYNGIIALHTEGMKQLIAENEALSKRVLELESKLL